MIVVLATFTVHAEHRADFLENARTLIAAAVRKPGCIAYDLLSSITEPNVFVFQGRWGSEAALDAHVRSDDVAEWDRVSEPFVESSATDVIHPERVETF